MCVSVCVTRAEVERRWGEGGDDGGKTWREEGSGSLLLLGQLLKRNNIPSRRQKGHKTSGSTIYDAN